MTTVVYTGGVLNDKERLVIVADRTTGYQIVTIADMGTTRGSITIGAMIYLTRNR